MRETTGAPDDARTDLVTEARAVLDENWLGRWTRPSPRLYPHQWSWDAGFVAMGYAWVDERRAEEEVRSLFRGQWADGLVPHIVFAEEGDYFPGPDFWRAERAAGAPVRPRTSGIVQPPVHATAVLRLARRRRHGGRARAFLDEVFPRLAAWHAYLHRERVRHEDGLAEIWHPWESGMDNSPLWDGPLGRLPTGRTPAYERADLRHADPSERPTQAEYDRYVDLVALFRDLGYDPARIREATPFAVQDVLFNSILVQADLDLAAIAREIGADPGPFEAWARTTARGIERKLWNEGLGIYLDHDVRADHPIPVRTAAAYAPLFPGVPSSARARAMAEDLVLRMAVEVDGGWAVPSFGLDEPGFLPTNYWRGPIWFNVNWLLYQGLRRYGFDTHAADLRRGLVGLVRRSGFHEHYDPTDGAGHGARRFAWTAALLLDLLLDGEP